MKHPYIVAGSTFVLLLAGCGDQDANLASPSGESAVAAAAFRGARNGAVEPGGRGGGTTFRITIENLTDGQPLSPPVVATHASSVRMFEVGELASPELEAIAEDGNPTPMFDSLQGAPGVTDVVNVGRPLTPAGTVAAGFDDTVTIEIQASAGDRLSLATMLICTNDGFTGLDSGRLPFGGDDDEDSDSDSSDDRRAARDDDDSDDDTDSDGDTDDGSDTVAVFYLAGYDAGTEDNTERSEDIVDPCSGLGPLELGGDPNGNENDAVDSDPHRDIRHHPEIEGDDDLDDDEHEWEDAVARVTVTRLSP